MELAGAEDAAVTFNKPIPIYVENFLAFPNGEPVPVGSYNQTTGLWQTEETGRVISIVGIDAQGRALVDIDATPGADNPSELFMDDEERRSLASRYPVGQSLWRFRAQHFSIWDANWAWEPVANATPPNQPPPRPDELPPDVPPCEVSGSIIECESQVLREQLPIAGTPFSLVYSSGRQRGSARQIRIPLTGGALPEDIRGIELEVTVAGRTLASMLPTPAPNLEAVIPWDGLGAGGQFLMGPQTVQVRLGYEFPVTYVRTSRFGYNGNGVRITGNKQRAAVTLWQDSEVHLGNVDARYAGLGGWMLNEHHVLDPRSEAVFLGDGTRSAIHESYYKTDLAFSGPRVQYGVEGPDGLLYLSTIDGTVKQVGPDGTGRTLASCNFCGGLAFGPDGLLYFTDTGYGNGILAVNPATGAAIWIAGGGARDTDGPVNGANVGGPLAIAFGQDGSLYYSERRLGTFGPRLRRIRDGWIETIASGNFDVIVPTPDGGLLASSYSEGRLIRIGPDGKQSLVAGGVSQVVPFYEGMPATLYNFGGMRGFARTPDGTLFLAINDSILRMDPEGKLTRVVGTGATGYSPHGLPASRTLLDQNGTFTPFANARGDLFVPVYDGRVFRIGTGQFDADAKRVVPSSDGERLFVFDARGKHLSTQNARTGTDLLRFEYDGQGLLVSATDADGQRTNIERDESGRALAIVAPHGQRTLLTVDGAQNLVGLARPDGGQYQFGYTADGLLTSLRDPKAASEGTGSYTFQYQGGRLVRDQAPDTGAQQLVRTDGANGWTVRRSTPLGRVTSHRFITAVGEEQRTVTHPDGTAASSVRRPDAATRYTVNGRQYDGRTIQANGTNVYTLSQSHSAYGRQAVFVGEQATVLPSGLSRLETHSESSTVSPTTRQILSSTESSTVNGRVTKKTFDGVARTFTTTTPAGRQTRRWLDEQGRTVRVESGSDLPTNFSYDSAGRLERIARGDRETMYTYAQAGAMAGYLSRVTDGLEQATEYARDALGQPLLQTLPDGHEVGFSWDGLGNMTGLVPPGRPGHAQSFDAVGQQLSYEPPSLSSASAATTFGYNLDRQLISMLRPDGVAVGLNYDSAGKLDVVTTPTGNYDYDYYGPTACNGCAPGKLSKITSPSGVALNFTYDGSLFKGATWTGPISGSLGFSYDNEFRISSESINTSTVRYGYEADSLVTCASLTSCSPAGADALRVTWDPLTPRVSTVTLGGTTESRAYNAYGELASLRALHGSQLVYAEFLDAPGEERDALGRIVTRTETLPSGTHVWRYSYDARGRLEQVLLDDELYEHLTYDPNGNRLQRETPTETLTATLDAQDRLLTYGPYAYTYTAHGELRTKTDTRTAQTTTYSYDARGNLARVDLPTGDVIEYVTDGLNRRVAKKKNGVIQKRWLYRDQLRIAAELDGSGALVSRFVYASRSNVPDFVVRGGVTYRVLSDHLGSPRLVVNAANAADVKQLVRHDAWGVVLEDSAPGWIPFGFAGGLYDPDTGLVRFGARDYDPPTGRWTAKDPILFKGGQSNLYAYVNNGPVNLTDRTGLYFCNQTSEPIRVGGTVGAGHGHTPGEDDTYREGWVQPGQCVGGDHGPLDTPDGPLHDVDVFDHDGDGEVERPMSNTPGTKADEVWNHGKIPWGDDRDRGICAVDLNPWKPGSTPIPWW